MKQIKCKKCGAKVPRWQMPSHRQYGCKPDKPVKPKFNIKIFMIAMIIGWIVLLYLKWKV